LCPLQYRHTLPLFQLFILSVCSWSMVPDGGRQRQPRRYLGPLTPVTTRQRGIPAELALGPEEGLPCPCVAKLDSSTTIPKASLRERVAYLTLVKRRAIDDALRCVLVLDQ